MCRFSGLCCKVCAGRVKKEEGGTEEEQNHLQRDVSPSSLSLFPLAPPPAPAPSCFWLCGFLTHPVRLHCVLGHLALGGSCCVLCAGFLPHHQHLALETNGIQWCGSCGWGQALGCPEGVLL